MSSSEGMHKRSIPESSAASHDAAANDDIKAASLNPTNIKGKNVKPPINIKGRNVLPLVIAVAAPLVLGIIDAVINNPNQEFYRSLKKPWWNPPGWLFGLAWSLLYPAMGFSSWLLWKHLGHLQLEAQIYPLGLYASQLILNLLWPYLFFGLHSIQLALIDIIALDALLIICIISFAKVDHLASDLFKPYLAWVSFASLLNYSILTMN